MKNFQVTFDVDEFIDNEGEAHAVWRTFVVFAENRSKAIAAAIPHVREAENIPNHMDLRFQASVKELTLNEVSLSAYPVYA